MKAVALIWDLQSISIRGVRFWCWNKHKPKPQRHILSIRHRKQNTAAWLTCHLTHLKTQSTTSDGFHFSTSVSYLLNSSVLQHHHIFFCPFGERCDVYSKRKETRRLLLYCIRHPTHSSHRELLPLSAADIYTTHTHPTVCVKHSEDMTRFSVIQKITQSFQLSDWLAWG